MIFVNTFCRFNSRFFSNRRQSMLASTTTKDLMSTSSAGGPYSGADQSLLIDGHPAPSLKEHTLREEEESGAPTGEEHINNLDEEGEEMMSDEDESHGHDVPTPIILSMLVGYMLLGALLLSYLEKWSFFDAFYFAFIRYCE